uniref:Exopolygalacturonase-like n=1 Tax=Cucumis melo TaxID=3656 RepID=A0A9I9E4G2_CUCME
MGVIKYLSLLVTTFMMALLSFTIETRSYVDVIFHLRKYDNIVSGADVTEMHGMTHVHLFVQVQWLFQREHLKLQTTPHGDSWITFAYVDRMTLLGGGVFDGQEKAGWEKNDCHKRIDCARLPISLRFNFITNSIVRRITSLDSKNFHVNILGYNNLTFNGVNIIAPEDSPNTDGIHIGRSIGSQS